MISSFCGKTLYLHFLGYFDKFDINFSFTKVLYEIWHFIFAEKLFTCISWDTLTNLTSTFPFKNPLHHRIVPSFRGTNWHILHQKNLMLFYKWLVSLAFRCSTRNYKAKTLCPIRFGYHESFLHPKTLRITPKSNDSFFTTNSFEIPLVY